MLKKIDDTMTATSLYRMISWPDSDYIDVTFYIDVPKNTLHIYKTQDGAMCWNFQQTGPIEDLLKFVALYTIDLNGYFEQMLTAEGFIKVRDKAYVLFDKMLKVERMKFEMGA